MGQYYKIVNVDKKEFLEPWSFNNGAKLTEWSYDRNPMVLAMMNLLAGDWKGDRVFVVGDYAEDDDVNEPCYETLRDLINELGIRDEVVDSYPDSVYKYATRNYEKVYFYTVDLGYRYIYNHALKQVIYLEKCPIEWTWLDKEEKKAYITKFAPLPLLLAMGNGRGGGDYYKGNNGFEYVGSWCSTVSDIEVTRETIEGIEYEEFAPDFTERKQMIPYTEAEKVIKECMEQLGG